MGQDGNESVSFGLTQLWPTERYPPWTGWSRCASSSLGAMTTRRLAWC